MDTAMTNDRDAQLRAIAADIEADNVAPRLREQATQLVFGSGPADAQLVFIGEAPGKNEDLGGEPFVGAAGKFLTVMLASIGLTRRDVYITNIVKYRPPKNRDPSRDEITEFLPYLERQLDVITPQLVVTLGRHAMHCFFPDLVIGQAHGQIMSLGGRKFMPLFHPAAALYNGGLRTTLLEDFAGIPQALSEA
jgi:uracil-DNA glycosylase family 4